MANNFTLKYSYLKKVGVYLIITMYLPKKANSGKGKGVRMCT